MSEDKQTYMYEGKQVRVVHYFGAENPAQMHPYVKLSDGDGWTYPRKTDPFHAKATVVENEHSDPRFHVGQRWKTISGMIFTVKVNGYNWVELDGCSKRMNKLELIRDFEYVTSNCTEPLPPHEYIIPSRARLVAYFTHKRKIR